jgi:hypothetical protein
VSDQEPITDERERAAHDEERWQRDNEAYLSAALHWLRVRLTRLAGPPESSEPEVSATPERSRLFRRHEEAEPRLALPAASLDSDLERAEAVLAAAEAAEPSPALQILAHRFGLSHFERNVLLLCAAIELDTGIAALCARAQQDPSRPYPTFALALTLFDEAAWDVLSPERPLRYWRLLEIHQPGAQPLTTSPLGADERVVNYVKGLNYLDDRLTPLLAPFDAAAGEALPPSQREAAEQIERILKRAGGDGPPPPLTQLVGIDPLSKQLVAQEAASSVGLNLYRMPVELLPQQAGEIENLARLWQRESNLLPIALFLDAHEQDGRDGGPKGEDGTPDTARPLQRFLSRSRGVFLLSTRELRSGLRPDMEAVAVAKPTPAEQRAAWAEALGEEAGTNPDLLAGQFDLNTVTIGRIAEKVRAEDAGAAPEAAAGEEGAEPGAGEEQPEVPSLHERLWDACLVSTGPQMERLAQRLRPVATWDDIVLPEDELRLLRQLADQVARRTMVYDDWGFRERMNRGLGISALFSGESGTGKTMAAEVIANHLRLALYRIDLSAVVSKYIGETEKNLRRLFDAAEDGGAILFFDEADALFGKRSEVRDSHDRYANIEINYLLQRIESYRGLAILATNMKSALDPAFMRRLRFVVTFPFPGRKEREAIWRGAWPADTPLGDLDYERLGRFNLTGGSITNIALNAAFLAAERGTAVTMPLVLDAARTELRKLERPVNEAELAWQEPEGTERPAEPQEPAERPKSSAPTAVEREVVG